MTCARGCCPTPRDHYLSIGISATATPSRSGPVVASIKREKDFDKDGPAYKRLRSQGLQPKRIDGCAEIEQRAESRIEVETMKPLTQKKKRQLEAITDNSVDRMKIHEPNGLMSK